MAVDVSRVPGQTARMSKQRMKSIIGKWTLFIILCGGAAVLLAPISWMLSTSLDTMQDIAVNSVSVIPLHFHWDNYVLAWQEAPFTRYTLNTLTITVIVLVGTVLSNSFVAYGFAKVQFPGRNFLFIILLSTMMIPGFTTLIPQYVMFSRFHWVGTYLPLTVPSFFGSSFYIFMMRQFYRTIPNELVEAAKMDGASHFYIWARLMVPLTKAALMTIGIFTFKDTWNDFLGPLIYISHDTMYTLQIGLTTFLGEVQSQWNQLMAASLLVLVPVLILFFAFQKYFIEGSNLTGATKG